MRLLRSGQRAPSWYGGTGGRSPGRRPRAWDTRLNQPGKPTQNVHIESFSRKFRDECLKKHWFQCMKLARVELVRWRADYNEVCPHSSCDRIPPAAALPTIVSISEVASGRKTSWPVALLPVSNVMTRPLCLKDQGFTTVAPSTKSVMPVPKSRITPHRTRAPADLRPPVDLLNTAETHQVA
ncbi:transposase [Delftia sp. WSY_7]|uniref:integrase core domain-containing protein n=1 Tax=Delftia sp. WSY_7 TaxID=3367202 RepID=UPI00370C1866